MQTTEKFPWDGIPPPLQEGAVDVRRAEPSHPADVFWGRDWQARPALVLEIQNDRPPSFRGTREIEVSSNQTSRGTELRLTLLSDEVEEPFFKLCTDLLESSRSETDSRRRTARILLRLENWMELLGHAPDRGLSGEEIRGLFAELSFMSSMIQAGLDPNRLVEAWLGPDRSSKDFRFGSLDVEIKSTGFRNPDAVRISSESQLALESDVLFLAIAQLTEATMGTSLNERVRELRELIRTRSSLPVLNEFDDRLAKSRYVPHERYDTPQFIESGMSFFQVEGEFPRLTQDSIPGGISGVGYSLSLSALDEWHIPHSAIEKAMRTAQ